MDLNKFNGHPWDKISHVLISLIIAVPFYALAAVVLFVSAWPSAALAVAVAGSAAALGVFYGREQFGHWKNHKDELLASWFFWNWSKDGQWDWYVVWPAQIALLAGTVAAARYLIAG